MNNSHKKYLVIGAPFAGRRHRAFLQNQRGSLLIGIIATIVILSALSGGLLYIFSSSSLNPVSGNFAQRAYMNAEAGINYVKALYRNAQTPAEGKTLLQTYESEQTINMPDGGTAKVTVSGMTSNYIPAEATYVSGANATLTLSPKSGSFPDAPGFFRKRNDGTIYRYTGKTVDGADIVLSGISPSVTGAANVDFVTNEQITIDSQGTVGLGLWNVNRKISYVWPLSGSKHGVPQDSPYQPDNSDVSKFNPSFFNTALASGIANILNWIRSLVSLPANYTATQILQWWFTKNKLLLPDEGHLIPSSGCGLLAESLGSYWYDQSESAIRVQALTGTYGGGFFLPYNYNFEQAWLNQGNKLSYDAQTKVKLKDGWFADRYLVGLSVRADSHCWEGWDLVNIPQYGFSFAKSSNPKFKLPSEGDIYIVFWRKFSESDYKLIAYKKLTVSDGILDGIDVFTDPMDTTNGWDITTSGVDDGIAWAIESPASAYYHSAPSARHVSTVPDHIWSGYVWDQWIANMTRSMPLEGVSEATVSFWHRTGPTDYFHISAYAYFQFDYDGNGTWDDLIEMQFWPDSSWKKAEHTFSNKPFTSNTKCRLRINVLGGVLGGRADFYIDDLQIKASRLKDWTTLGVRVREKLSPRSNEFEVFYGHPGAGNNGTGPNEIPYDVNRGPCLRDQNCWLPMSPINIMSSSVDKLTLVTANPSDPHASANPWYWWYDNDGNYKDTVDDGVTDYSVKNKGTFPTTSPRPVDSDGCVYTLTGGTSPYGSLEPSAVIKTSGNNCRTTEYYTNYINSSNQVEEFGIHVYSAITGDTGITGSAWFDDTNILITDGASQYGSGVQR